MHTLGINAAFHDCSAALVCDGKVIAAAEEERFTRIKHGKRPVPFSTWHLPFHAIDYCLREADIALTELAHVAYAFDPDVLLGSEATRTTISLPLEPSAHASDWLAPWDPLLLSSVVNAPRQLASGAPHHLQERFAGARHDGPYRWHFVDHHLAHEASAFLAAPFDSCAVLTMDGRGERATTSYGVYRDHCYRRIRQVNLPHSLGLLYEAVTGYLGFLHAADEYKVMALASFGVPVYAATFREIVRYQGAGDYRITEVDFRQLFGPPRRRGSAVTQQHMDIARSLQVVLQETVLQMVHWLQRETGERQLALAGGVALNCVLNAVLRRQGGFEQVWVQPAAGDAGTALGAALWIDARARRTPAPSAPEALTPPGPAGEAAMASFPEASASMVANPSVSRSPVPADDNLPGLRSAGPPMRLAPRRWHMQDVFLGPSYKDDAIEAFLRQTGLPYQRVDDIVVASAALLAENKLLGWFQGRMEFGPRALGARSILASPLHADMQARLNRLKDREDFRPVAPMVPEEVADEWFTDAGVAPFMVFVFDVKHDRAERIPAVRHVDGSARVQTVHRDGQPMLHRLLWAFSGHTDVPVLINTSFNTRGEPIVCTPRDAIESFCSTPLDALAIGSFLLQKDWLHV